MSKMNLLVTQTLHQAGVRTRPNADAGVWIMFLLPVSIIYCCLTHLQETSQIYQFCAALSVGLIGTSFVFVVQCIRGKPLNIVRTLHLVPATLTATIFRFFLHGGLFLSLTSGLVSSIMYWKFLIGVLRLFPWSFSLGEASIAVQGLMLFLYSTVFNLNSALFHRPVKTVHVSTLIIQLGLCTLGVICLLIYRYKNLRQTVPFYLTSGLLIVVCFLLPLHLILGQSVFFWLVQFLFEDFSRANTLVYWSACVIAAALAVNRQISLAKRATPSVRKVFHILAVAVFLPGLIYQCTLLYLASGIALGVFVVLEMFAILKIPPIGVTLNEALTTYRDEKDTGEVAFTPLYLLVGCALPLWIHPAPCDMLDSASFNLLPVTSGVLAIGVGDTVASVVGTAFGKHFWSGSKKTIEGTIGCAVSQLLVVYALTHLGFFGLNNQEIIKATLGCVVGSLVEAKTTQIDNIVLPFVLFIVFC